MKTTCLTHTVLLISMAALTPAALAQNNASGKPGTGVTTTGTTGTTDTADRTGTTDRTRATDRTDVTGRTGTTDRTGTPGTSATGEQANIQSGSLTTVIADNASYSTLTKAIKAAGLEATLGNKNEFTVFAPTDEAFAKLPAGTLDKLMLPENKDKLRLLLLNHVVTGKKLAADLTDGDVKAANGEKLEVNVSGDKVEVNGAKVSSADVSATNGVVHGIDKVLVPKSLGGFVSLES